MPKETSLNTENAFAKLTEQGAVSTHLVLVQHDDSNPYNCSMYARGVTAAGDTLQDILLCPTPCKIGQAFNPAT